MKSYSSKFSIVYLEFLFYRPVITDFAKRYIYSGEITLSEYAVPTLLDILIAADELILEALIDYIQDYIIENYTNDMKQILHSSIKQT